MIDMIGKRFGKLLVLSEAGRDKHRNILWLCRCDCGKEKIISGSSLRSGLTKSCGCLARQPKSKEMKKKMSKRMSGENNPMFGKKGIVIDILNKRFGRLLVLRQVGKKYGRPAWFCVCDCGNTKIIAGAQLRSGNTKSCGCLHKEKVIELRKGKSCSKKTKQKISEAKKGKKRPPFSEEWKNNLSKARKRNNQGYNPNLPVKYRINRRLIPGYSDWVQAVFNRDDYICQCCSERGGKLHAHHLESYSDNPQLRITLENGITLCKKCHKDFHHQYGYKCTKQQFENFFVHRENLVDLKI